MEVKLKCKCTDGEIALQVPQRNEDEDIADYMHRLQVFLGNWHSNRQCTEAALEYLKMPIIEGKGIGEQ